MVSLPSPTLQKVNALLHKEPIASIFYGLYWSTVFVIGLPFVVMFLQVQIVVNVLSWYWTKSSKKNFHPNNKPEYDFSIVITGCDTGFGKDLAIHCADMGYTVFAGCYRYESSKQLFTTIAKIIPFSLDVTKDNDVNEGAALVRKWLEEKNVPVQDLGRKRVLHALINNAGIGTFGTFMIQNSNIMIDPGCIPFVIVFIVWIRNMIFIETTTSFYLTSLLLAYPFLSQVKRVTRPCKSIRT
jgi:short chain dehydrogenase